MNNNITILPFNKYGKYEYETDNEIKNNILSFTKQTK